MQKRRTTTKLNWDWTGARSKQRRAAGIRESHGTGINDDNATATSTGLKYTQRADEETGGQT